MKTIPKLTLLNTTIATNPGRYSLEPCTLERARLLVHNTVEVQSAIGHAATAQIMTELLLQPVPVNRIEYSQQPTELALCFKLKQRAPEGAILTIEQIEAIGYEFLLLRRQPEWKDISIAVHGSVLHKAGPADIDVIATHDTPEVRNFLRHELVARGWGHLPMDLQFGRRVPALPCCDARPVLTLAGPPLEQRTCWDLSAWVRACENSPLARFEFRRLIQERCVLGRKVLDTRWVGIEEPGVVFVSEEDPGLTGNYHGGGRVGLGNASRKAPRGWAWVLETLPPGARAFLAGWLENGHLPEDLKKYRRTAPTASNGELLVTMFGLCGAYAPANTFWPWPEAPQPAVCGTKGDGAFGGPRES